MIAVAKWGLDATFEEVAEAAGVSRRTVTRHFASHSELIVATIDEIRRTINSYAPRPPVFGQDIETWLTECAITLHTIYRENIGRAFWDLFVDRPNGSQEVSAKIAGAMEVRRHYAEAITRAAWDALGGPGDPPVWVRDTFSIQLSGFATNALPEHSAKETGLLCARVLWLVINLALSEQGREHAVTR